MSKIYWSTHSDPKSFEGLKFYYFPKAYWLIRRKWGVAILKFYLAFRLLFEEIK